MSESTDDEPEITAMVLEARRWESDKRWYQALLIRDLFGQITVLRIWGGKQNQKHGQKTRVFASEAEARRYLKQTAQRRLARPAGYQEIDND